MAGASIQVDADTTQVRDLLTQLQDKLGNIRPALYEIAGYLEEVTDERFATGTDPSGEPWHPLSEAYKAQRLKKGKGETILVLDGLMRDSIVSHVSDVALVFGTNRIQAATHQLGDVTRGIPAREFLGINATDEAEILEILFEHLAIQ